MPDTDPLGEPVLAQQRRSRPRRRRWLRTAAMLLLLVLIVLLVRRLLGDVDWTEVGRAIGHLAWWQLLVLAAGLLLRQFLNALPLSLFIEGCSPLRAVQNDQAAIVMTTIAPPPSDVVLRVAMFKSWGIPTAAGMAGTVMNSAAYYVVRFGAPLLGVFLMLITGDIDLGEFTSAVMSSCVSIVLLLSLWAAFRQEAFAAGLARRLGVLARRVNGSADPQAWADWAVDFRASAVKRFPWAFPWSLAALTGMVIVDALLLMTAIHFVGGGDFSVSPVEALVAFLVAYPLTLFPFAGLGILDATVVAILLATGAGAHEETLLAGFVVWRVTTLIGPELFGLLSLALWRLELAVRRGRP